MLRLRYNDKLYMENASKQINYYIVNCMHFLCLSKTQYSEDQYSEDQYCHLLYFQYVYHREANFTIHFLALLFRYITFCIHIAFKRKHVDRG